MKLFHLKKIKIINLSLVVIVFISLTSCGTYQSVYNEDDGIYASSNRKKTTEEEVVRRVANEYENYFANKLDEYRNIQSGDLLTDIDNYQYGNQDLEVINDTINGDLKNGNLNNSYTNTPWGNSANPPITINTYSGYEYYRHSYYDNYYWTLGYNPYYYGYNSYYRGYNPHCNYYRGYRNSWYKCGYGYYNSYYGGYYDNNYAYNYNRGRRYDTYGKRKTYNTRNNSTRRRSIRGVNRRATDIITRGRISKRNTRRNIITNESIHVRRSSIKRLRNTRNTENNTRQLRRNDKLSPRNSNRSTKSTRRRTITPRRKPTSSFINQSYNRSSSSSTRSNGRSRRSSSNRRR